MFGNDDFVGTFGIVAPGDDESLIKIVSAAVRGGYAIVLDAPGEKRPICTLTAIQRNRADREAKDAAAAIGDPFFARRVHACGLHHALTVAGLTGTEELPEGDPKKVATKVGAVIRRVTKASGGRTPNIGIELGRSRMLVVDVDTEAELFGFMRDWDAQSENTTPTYGMTVRSPGVLNKDGDWVHKNGGHFWFTIPEDVELPAGVGAFTAPAGWVAMWADHQVLVPPSSRAEGAYELVGQVNPAPEWLIAMILHEASARMDRVKNRAELPDGTGDIDVWAAGLPWIDILEPDGWLSTGLPDRCSCPIYTAPGAHASPKSATAHDIGCSHYDTSPGHAPLHIWTDNPPDFLFDAIRAKGTKTFSKLQYLAWRDHGGVIRPVLNEYGLNSNDAEYPGFSGAQPLETWNAVDAALTDREERTVGVNVGTVDPSDLDTEGGDTDTSSATSQSTQTVDSRPLSPFLQPGTSAPAGGTEQAPEEGTDDLTPAREPTRAEIIRSLLVSSEELDSIKDPEPVIEGVFDQDTLARITGKSGHGKTFVALDMAACVATGLHWHGHKVSQGLVIYMVAEGVRGFKKRLRAWEAKYNGGEPISKDRLLIMPVAIQTASQDWPIWRAILAELKPVLLFLDTQARITVGVNENDATEMGIFVDRLESIRHATRGCVVTVHHLGHNGEQGRGSTAVIGALNTEVRVRKTEKGLHTVEMEKQKDNEETDPLKFKMEVSGDSVILVPDGWVAVDPDGDPFDVPAPPVKVSAPGVNRESSARDRLAAALHDLFGHGDGGTKSEICSVMKSLAGHPVYGRMSQSMAYRAWSQLIKDKVLDQQKSAAGKKIQKFKLSAEEVTRLCLAPAGEASASLPDVAPTPAEAAPAPAAELPETEDGDAA